MVKIKFGPAGIGKISDIVEGLKVYHEKGFEAAEIPFTYGVFIKKDKHKEEIENIRKAAEDFGIQLSIHAPYWINLNSDDEEKIEASKKRILDSCEIGHLIGANKIVFHSGYYGKEGDRKLAYDNIKERVSELLVEIKKNKWNVDLCPEVMGKINVFGSIEEISKLVSETGCGFCIDFAHVLARYGEYNFKEIERAFPQDNWQCHFSGIEYGEKGEKNHKMTSPENWGAVIGFLKTLDKDVIVICESPDPVGDSILGIETAKKEGLF
jgi:deoxyribonuclease IV